MIAPEPGEGINKQTSRVVLLRKSLLVSALIFAVLEFWRHCFFLTDDNLDGALPVLTELGRHFLHGPSLFYCDYLYGGHYDMRRDVTFLIWDPFFLVTCLLADTPFYYAIIDVNAFLCLMLATAGFVNLAWYLRREMPLKISDGWIIFFAMSFTYTVIMLTTGASWINYLINQSVLPWLTLGIVQKKWRAGVGLIALFMVHQILGGHPLAMISNNIFLTVFAVGVCLCRRSMVPLASWVIGCSLALVVTLPILLPGLAGFFASARSQGVTLFDMQSNGIEVGEFPTGFFFGMALWLVHPPAHVHVTYTLALCSSAAAWCIIPAILSRAKWGALEIVTGFVLFLTFFMVCRPDWFGEIMLRLPVLKSMRWPFRELVQFQFFFHLFLLVRPPGFTVAQQRVVAVFSAYVMIVPLFLYKIGPTLNEMPLGRRMVFSGDLDRYWDRVRPLLNPTDRVAVLMPYKVYLDDFHEKPNALLTTFNYAILVRIVSASGYSHTAPADQLYTRTIPYYPNGAYESSQQPALLAERPDLKFITLESLHPLRITLSSKDGPTIDLTPYAPDYFRNQ